MKLSDLTPGDVAVFVRADGSESEPFVVTDTEIESGGVRIDGPHRLTRWYLGSHPVRRLGRGRLVPARIEMEGEAIQPDIEALQERVRRLREAVQDALTTGEREMQQILDNGRLRDALRAALAATAPNGESK